jgi:hypothetical protein
VIANVFVRGVDPRIVFRPFATILMELRPFVTYVGDHPTEDDGVQMIMQFPNGWGASIAETSMTQGLQMHEIRLCHGEWILDGELKVGLEGEYLCELLLEIKERT